MIFGDIRTTPVIPSDALSEARLVARHMFVCRLRFHHGLGRYAHPFIRSERSREESTVRYSGVIVASTFSYPRKHSSHVSRSPDRGTHETTVRLFSNHQERECTCTFTKIQKRTTMTQSRLLSGAYTQPAKPVDYSHVHIKRTSPQSSTLFACWRKETNRDYDDHRHRQFTTIHSPSRRSEVARGRPRRLRRQR